MYGRRAHCVTVLQGSVSMKKVRAFHRTEVVNLGDAVIQCTKRTRRKRSPNKFRTTSPTTIFLPVTYPPTRCLIVSFFSPPATINDWRIVWRKSFIAFFRLFRFLGCQVTCTHTSVCTYIIKLIYNWDFLVGNPIVPRALTLDASWNSGRHLYNYV